MGTDGEGIGHYDGMTFFVKDALIGDVITARATKLKKNYGYARVEEIKTPSTFRVEPQCELHKRCGGCQIQALSYEKQLEFKNNKVRNNLMRIGGFFPRQSWTAKCSRLLAQTIHTATATRHSFRWDMTGMAI